MTLEFTLTAARMAMIARIAVIVVVVTIITLATAIATTAGAIPEQQAKIPPQPMQKQQEEETETTAPLPSSVSSTVEQVTACQEILKETVRSEHRDRLLPFCERADRLPSCTSTEGRPIPHIDAKSGDARGKRILVFGLIHGDEPLAGEMTLEWAERLKTIPHRNEWRVVPMLNPDGLKRRTRMNARGVDLNRNFPTKDWPEEAVPYWKKQMKADPRRFPGEAAGSEAETRCAIAHIKEFKPDFIISNHTPYKVLDFDGPRMRFPPYRDLPWRALGNFPGSLGRFMWKDYSIPVLTVELGHSMVDAARLQDIVGGFAIEAARLSGTKTAGIFDLM